MSMQYHSGQDFTGLALEFKKRMAEGLDLEALHKLWRETSYPYRIDIEDPFAKSYRDAVLNMYETLTNTSYDIQNEMTSTLQTPENFKIGYPWVSKNLRVVAHEMGKAVHGMREIHAHMPEAHDIVEFGSGWGNLAVPLARAGKAVTAVDIDDGFLSRMMDEARALSIDTLQPVHADFIEAATRPDKRYDIALFSSSFHHCLDFVDLLQAIRENVLKPNGKVFFFAEPISSELSFPWGLRYDGESIWAITCNGWLELGFSEDFFRTLMTRTGYTVEKHTDHVGGMGDLWVATSV